MKHLNIFSPISEYEKAKADNLLNRPNVSLVDEDKTVRYLIDIDVDPPVIGPPIDNNEYEYVDLGLPSGLKWAKCNIGATSETDYGLYFQWAATEGYTAEQIENGEKVFDWANYKYCNGSSTTITKYCMTESYGTVDGKSQLEPEDDAATQLMGKDWRMPTTDEYQNLKDGTLWVWSPANTIVKVKAKDGEGKDTIIDVNYPAGYFVYKVKNDADKGKVVYEGGEIPANYSPNAHYEGEGESQVIVDGDTHIFFPCSGFASGTVVDYRGSRGYYWSSSLGTSNSDYGHDLRFGSGYIYPQYGCGRYFGFCVRSVSET